MSDSVCSCGATNFDICRERPFTTHSILGGYKHIKSAEGLADFLIDNQGILFKPLEESVNEGKKNDGGKPPVALLSGAFIFEVAKVLDFGQHKYDPWNWKGGFIWSRVISGVLRHIFQWLGGEDKDSESKLGHLAHAACGLMFLIDFEINKLGTDDRFKSAVKQDTTKPIQDLRQG